jgi:hypothetical protein
MAAKDEKNDDRWVVMMERQDIKIVLKNELFAVKIGKEDFMLLTADTWTMDAEMKGWYLGEQEAILQRRRRRAPPKPTSTMAPSPMLMPTATPTTTPTSTSSMPETGPTQVSIAVSEEETIVLVCVVMCGRNWRAFFAAGTLSP